jgi:nuclear transport factor 2 (NTF2) superfamily protein
MSARGSAHNPEATEEAAAFVKYVESLFNPWNVDALVDGFTPDCVVRFCDIPEFIGQEKLRDFFLTRSKRQKDYKLVKTMRSYANNVISGIGHGEWIDLSTGKHMWGFGVEIWHLRDGKIAVWEGAFNAAPVGEGGASGPLTKWSPS